MSVFFISLFLVLTHTISHQIFTFLAMTFYSPNNAIWLLLGCKSHTTYVNIDLRLFRHLHTPFRLCSSRIIQIYKTQCVSVYMCVSYSPTKSNDLGAYHFIWCPDIMEYFIVTKKGLHSFRLLPIFL